MRHSLVFGLVLLGLVIADEGSADTIVGQPVGSFGSTTGVGDFDPVTGRVGFFIPLDSSNAGVYGVTPHPGGLAGTFGDAGFGIASLSDPAVLTTYLHFGGFSTTGLVDARVALRFADLDLTPASDPDGFFESIQISAFDANGNEVVLTPLLADAGQDGAGFSILQIGDVTTINLLGLAPLLGSLGSDLWLKLDFNVHSTEWMNENTPEFFRARLTTVTRSVPEPGLAGLAMIGLVALGGAVGRWRRIRAPEVRLSSS
jgi:hypothetical protein